MSRARMVSSSLARARDVLARAAVACLLGAFPLLALPGCGSRAPAAVRAADALYAEGLWEEAAAAFASMPEETGRWRAYGDWRAAAIYRDALHDPVRAEEAFIDCTRQAGGEEWSYACQVDRGDMLRDSGQLREAIGAYRRALELRPQGNQAAHCLLETGRAYLQLGEPEQARVEWEELLSRFGGEGIAPSVALEIARSFDMQGDPRGALEAYRAVQERWPEHGVVPLAAFGEGEALEQLGRLEEAAAVFRRALAIHPNPGAVRIKLDAVQERLVRRAEGKGPPLDMGLQTEEGVREPDPAFDPARASPASPKVDAGPATPAPSTR